MMVNGLFPGSRKMKNKDKFIMNKNIRIAKDLVKIARELIAEQMMKVGNIGSKYNYNMFSPDFTIPKFKKDKENMYKVCRSDGKIIQVASLEEILYIFGEGLRKQLLEKQKVTFPDGEYVEKI